MASRKRKAETQWQNMLGYMTVPLLKQVLQEMGVTRSGRKSDLQDRIRLTIQVGWVHSSNVRLTRALCITRLQSWDQAHVYTSTPSSSNAIQSIERIYGEMLDASGAKRQAAAKPRQDPLDSFDRYLDPLFNIMGGGVAVGAGSAAASCCRLRPSTIVCTVSAATRRTSAQ